MASSAPAARRRGVAKPPLMPRANERDDDDAPARAARDGATATDAVAPTMRRTPSFSDELGHYVKGFGRHDAYAGGEQVRERDARAREDSTRREGERRRAVGEGRDGRENED
jgi:hypothetical protein